MIRILLSLIIISTSLSELTQGQTKPKLQQMGIGQVVDLGPEDPNPYYFLKLTSSQVSGGKIASISSISDQRSELKIYIKQWPMDTSQQTIMNSLPSSADFDISCVNENIVSCLVTQVTADSIFVISLIKMEISSCILLSEIVDVQDLQLFQEEKIANFQNGFVQIFKFDLGQFDAESQLQQIVLRADYQSIQSVDNKMQYKLFTLQALPETIRTSEQAQVIRSYSLGAYGKQLKLSAHIPYYIILISESGQQLSLTSQIPSSYLSLSLPIQYMYISALQQQLAQINQFTYSFDSANLSSQYGLYIERLAGDGLAKIYACDVSYDYQPLLGSSLYLVIPATVLSCSNPKLGISIFNVDVQIAVRILLEPYDQSIQVQNGMLYLSQMRVEVVDSVPSSCISYAVEPLQIDTKQNMFLECKSSIPDLNLTVKTCTISPDQEQPFCRSLTRKFNSSQPNLLYMQKSSQTTQIQICPTSNSSQTNPNYYYSILVMAYPQVKKLKFDQPSFQVINSGQLVLFQIDGAVQNKPSLTVEVRARLINGDIKFSQNCTISINLKNFCHNNDLDMAWAYSASYNFTQLGPEYSLSNVYFGVEGQSQSVYQIMAYIVDHNDQPQPDPPGPTPQPTKHLKLKDGLNEWQLKPGQSLTYTYTSHITPYSLQLGQNSQQAMVCVQVFESEAGMDISAPCSSQQSQIFSVNYTQQILYVRLTSQQQSNFTFELQIIVPNIAISDKSSLLLSCQKSCWSQIKVMYFDWSKESIISSSGSGFINSTPGSNATVLKFTSIPFIFTAFLPDGGELYLQAGNNVQVVGQNKSLLKITAYKDLAIIAPIQDISTLLINAFGRHISAFQRLFSHNKSTSSYSYFEYPSNSDTIINPSIYSSGSIPLYLSKDLPIPSQCRSQQMSCYYTVLIANGEFNFDIINEDTDIQVAMNSVDNRLFLNVPVQIQTGFGIWYLEPFLLMGDGEGKEDQAVDGPNQVQFNYRVKPMSGCGNIQMSLVDNSNNQFPSTQKGKIGQIASTSGCMVKVCMTICPLPFQFTGIPQQITFTPSQTDYTFLYSASGRQQIDFRLGAWGKNTNSNSNNENATESSIDSFIVNVFQVVDVSDCQSKGNVLVATEVMTISEQSIYLNRFHEETITVSGSTTNNLYLVRVSASSAVKSTATINIIISVKDEVQTLLPNTALRPLLPQQPLQYQFYSDLYMWELCYITPSSSDDSAQFIILVQDDFGKNVQKKATFSQDETCFMVVKREIKTGLIRYKVNFGFDADVYGHILWVRAKEQVEAVEMRHALTTLYQPPNLLESLPNGDYGYCIDYSIKNILSQIQIPIILYPTQRDSMGKISLPDTKLVYKEEHIISSRTKEVIAHKLLFDTKQLQSNIEVCYATGSGFYTKALPQSQGFYSVLNEQNVGLQFQVQAGKTKKYVFYFNDFDVGNKQQKNQSLIIQLISCNDNSNNAIFYGSSSLQDLILTPTQEFDRLLFFQSVKIFHTSLKNDDNSYYFAIKNDGQSIPFSLTMYKIKGYQIPQQRWNLTDKKINAFRSEDKNDLIVHLPAAISTKSGISPVINYTVYIVNNDNSTLSAIRKKDLKCPILKSGQMKQVEIKNMTLTNPKVPIFKINIKQLSGNKFIVLANAIIKEDKDSVPLTYFYYDQEIELNLQEENQSGAGSFRLGVIFGILILAVFLVLLFRIFYKVIRKRMATNTVEFQLSEQERQNTAQNENQSQQPAPVQNRSSVRDSVGYGEFVEQQVVV